jgi:hypothetical protein
VFLGYTADQSVVAGLIARDAPGGMPYPRLLPDVRSDTDPGVNDFGGGNLMVFVTSGFQPWLIPEGRSLAERPTDGGTRDGLC